MTQPANRRLATEAYVTTTAGALQKVAGTVTASGALVLAKHNPVDASGGAKTMTLPTGQAEGTQVSVEKTDSSVNTVSITGSIRGVGSSTIVLPWQNEALLLRADSAGSWWPISGHKTKASLDATYGDPGVAALVNNGASATRGALGAALVPGSIYKPDGTKDLTKRLDIVLDANGDIDDLIIETVTP